MKQTILIAEDEADIRNILRLYLESENYEVLEAAEGIQKKEKLSELKNEIVNAYRYYTDQAKNPSKSLTRIEYDAFFGLVESYEARGGDGYVHTEIIPAMERLSVIEMENVPPRQFVSSYTIPAADTAK